MNRRIVMAAIAALAGLALQPASAQWPDRPLKLVVPYPPGGISDALGRHVAGVLETDQIGRAHV